MASLQRGRVRDADATSQRFSRCRGCRARVGPTNTRARTNVISSEKQGTAWVFSRPQPGSKTIQAAAIRRYHTRLTRRCGLRCDQFRTRRSGTAAPPSLMPAVAAAVTLQPAGLHQSESAVVQHQLPLAAHLMRAACNAPAAGDAPAITPSLFTLGVRFAETTSRLSACSGDRQRKLDEGEGCRASARPAHRPPGPRSRRRPHRYLRGRRTPITDRTTAPCFRRTRLPPSTCRPRPCWCPR